MNIDQKKRDDVTKRTDINETNLAYLAASFANQIVPEIKEKLIEKAEDFLSPKKGEIIQDELLQYEDKRDLFEKFVCDPAKQNLKSETYERS